MATNRPSLTDRVEVLEQAAEDRGGGISDLRNLSARVDDLETRGEKRAQDTAQQVETLTNRVAKGERDILTARQELHNRVESLEQDRTGGELGELTKGVVYPPQDGTGKGKVIDRLVTELVYRTKGLHPGEFREWLRDLIEREGALPDGIKAFGTRIAGEAEQYIIERLAEVVGTATTESDLAPLAALNVRLGRIETDINCARSNEAVALADVQNRVGQVLEGVNELLKSEPSAGGCWVDPVVFRGWLHDLIISEAKPGIPANEVARVVSELAARVLTSGENPTTAKPEPVAEPKAQYMLSIATIKGGIVRSIVVTADDLPSEYRDTDVETWGLLEWTAAVAGFLNAGEYVKWASPV